MRTSAVGGGATDVKQNVFIEAHGTAREVVEKSFRFTPRTLGIIGIFGVAVPMLIYKGCVAEFVSAHQHPLISRCFHSLPNKLAAQNLPVWHQAPGARHWSGRPPRALSKP